MLKQVQQDATRGFAKTYVTLNFRPDGRTGVSGSLLLSSNGLR